MTSEARTRVAGYDTAHLTADPARSTLWHAIASHLAPWIPPSAHVLRDRSRVLRLDRPGAGTPGRRGPLVTDVSLPALLRSHGFAIEAVRRCFLPCSMRGAGALVIPWLVRAYLRSPVKPLAGQMLVVARRA